MLQAKVKLRIYGMTCDYCVNTVRSGLKNQDGVIDVKMSLEHGTGEVGVDSEKVKPEELLKNRVFGKPSHHRAMLMGK